MGSIMRLLVGAGLFALGYYMGRQSIQLESMQDYTDPRDTDDELNSESQSDVPQRK